MTHRLRDSPKKFVIFVLHTSLNQDPILLLGEFRNEGKKEEKETTSKIVHHIDISRESTRSYGVFRVVSLQIFQLARLPRATRVNHAFYLHSGAPSSARNLHKREFNLLAPLLPPPRFLNIQCEKHGKSLRFVSGVLKSAEESPV